MENEQFRCLYLIDQVQSVTDLSVIDNLILLFSHLLSNSVQLPFETAIFNVWFWMILRLLGLTSLRKMVFLLHSKKKEKKLFYVLMLSTIYLNFLKFKLVYLIHTENKIHYKAKWDKPVCFNKPKTWWNISFSKRSLCKKCPLQFFWSNCAPMKVRESAESLGKRWVTGTALSHKMCGIWLVFFIFYYF